MAASAAPAKKVEAPVEKSTSAPIAASSAPTPPHGDDLQERKPTTAVTAPTPTPASESATPPHGDQLTDEKPKVRKIEHKVAEPVDLLDAAGVPVAKRAVPLVAGVLVILWFLRRRRNRRS